MIKSPRPAQKKITIFILCALCAAVLLCLCTIAFRKVKLIQMGLDALSIFAMEQHATGYPADVGITSVTQLKKLLMEKAYLTAGQVEDLHLERFDIGNVSKSDPAETIAIRSKSNIFPGNMVIVHLGGDCGSHRSPQIQELENKHEPPRNPPWLAP